MSVSLPPERVDVVANRRAKKWNRSEQLRRMLWALSQPLFFLSPRPFWVWRRVLLRLFGAKVARGVHVYPTARITIPWNLTLEENCAIGDRVIVYALGAVHIGARATISQGAHLCAGSHDWRDPLMPLLKLPVTICDDVWICADAFVGPRVLVGEGAIVGARAVVMRSVPDHAIVAGNPATRIGTR